MANFDSYAPLLKRLEGYGKYTNLPSDKGGPTMSGVTLTTFQQFYGKNKTIFDLQSMTYSQWRYIMKTGYWDKAGADNIRNQSVAELIVDFCVNSGVKMLKRIQRIVCETEDGIIGPKTLTAINSAPQALLYNAIMAERRCRYYEIVANNPSQKVNLRGWLNRLDLMHFSR